MPWPCDLAAITAGDGSQGFVLQGELAGDWSGYVGVLGRGRQRRRLRRPDRRGARADGPADGRSDAGDSYVVFGKAGGFAPPSTSPPSPPATAARASCSRASGGRPVGPFGRPRPGTSTATASTT